MSFWSGETFKSNKHVVDDFIDDQIDCNCYSVRMGDMYYRTANKENEPTTKSSLKTGESFVIPPGQFAYLLSKESVNIPSAVMGLISMRTGLKFQGLINVSGFHVDPGYSGKLVFAVYNAGTLPVSLSEGENIYKLWLSEIDNVNTTHVFRKAGTNTISNELVRGMSREILSLQSVSEKMRELDAKIEARLSEQKPLIDYLSLVFRTITLGVVALIIGAILALAAPTVAYWGGTLAKKYGIIPTTTETDQKRDAANTPSTGAKRGASVQRSSP